MGLLEEFTATPLTGLGRAMCGLRPEFFSKPAFLRSWISQRVMAVVLGSLSAAKRP